jgi:hypothetical protein
MAIDARIISLKARAKNAADLSTPVSGTLETVTSSGELGAAVSAFNIRTALYPRLGDLELDAADKPTGRLKFGSVALRAELLPKALCVLNNEIQAANLDQAILARQNEFLSRYQFITDMLTAVGKAYPAKIDALAALQQLVNEEHADIENAYGGEAATLEDPAHNPTMRPTTVTTVKLAGIATIQTNAVEVHDGISTGPVRQTHTMLDAPTRLAQKEAGAWKEFDNPKPVLVSQQATTITQSDEIAHPRKQNHIRHARLSADLLGEILAETVFALRVPNLRKIWENELKDIDLAIRKLQLAYIDTFVLPTIAGRVTSYLKQPGENVRAGETIMRIEDQATLFLVGQLRCLGPISVGQPVVVKTDNVFASSPPVSLTLNGTVVMARGYDLESAKWNVVFAVPNFGAVKIPVGYEFESSPGFTTIKVG